jgi:RHS repeat-associated protein
MVGTFFRRVRSWLRPGIHKSLLARRPTRLQLEILEDRLAPATDIWLVAASGNFRDASRWSLGVVPGPNDVAVISPTGPDYTVTLDANATVGSFALSSANATLLIQGNSSVGDVTLTAASGFSNAGTITLQSANGGFASNLAVTNGTLTNTSTGIINSNVGSGGPRTIAANLLNNGTINVNQSATFSTTNGTYTNAGALNIATGAGLSISGSGQVFKQTGGSLNNNGGFGVSGGATFDFAGGTLAGNAPVMSGASLKVEAAATGTIAVLGNSTLLGDVPAGAPTILVQGNSSVGDVTLTAASGFSNAGTITLQSANGGFASNLAVTNGTLTNTSTGIINSNAGSGGPRTIVANLLNNGTINVNQSATFSTTNGTYTNAGAINTASGAGLSISGSGQTFTQSGGSLNNNGGFGVSGGATFDFAGGTLAGNAPVMSGASLKVEAAATGTIAVLGNSTLLGDVPAGAPTILVQGNGSVGDVTLNLADGTVNNGTIDLTTIVSNYTVQLTSQGTFTNGATGTIEAMVGAGGSRYLNGTVVNQGTITVDASANLTAQNSTFSQNGGTLNVNGSWSDAQETFNFNGGTVNVSGYFQVSGGTFNFNGGTTSSNALTLVGATLNGAASASGQASFVVSAGGSSTLSGTLAHGVTVTVQADASHGDATLNATNGAVNNGTINLTSTSSGQTAHLTSAGTFTNGATGIVAVLTGTGGSRDLNGNVVNQGTITVPSGITLTLQNGVFTQNGGSINASGSLASSQETLNFNSGTSTLNGAGTLSTSTFNFNGGLLAVGGFQGLQQSIFNFNGGTISGAVTLIGSTLNSIATAIGPASFVVSAGSSISTLSGTLAQGVTVTVQAEASHGDATLNVTNGAVNNGTINLTSSSSGQTAQLNCAGTFTSAGTIEAQPGSGGSRYLTGTIANYGLIGIAPGITLTVTGTSLTNQPSALITGGGTLNTSGVTFVNHGTVALTMPSVLDEELKPAALQVTYVSTNGMNAATVTNAANYTITGSGGGSIQISGITYNSTTGVATIAFSQDLPADIYRVSINGDAVRDNSGTHLYPNGSIVVTRVLGIMPAQATVSLDPASNSGAPNHPGFTNVTTPTFDVQVNQGGTITVDFDGNAAHDQSRAVSTAGTYQFTAPALTNGTYTATARFVTARQGTATSTTAYTIDTAHPYVTSLNPTGPIGTSVAQATVTFSELVDLNTFAPSAITLTGPGGNIAVSQPQLVSGTRYSIPFPAQTTVGSYTLTIGPSVTNFAGNKIDQDQNGTNHGFSGSFTIALPDLVVTGLTRVSPASPQSGNVVTINWNDVNLGNFATTGSWTDSVTVVNTTTGATLLSAASVPYTGPNIAINGSALQVYAFTLPDGAAGVGNIQVMVTANANHALVESNYTNNTASTSFSATLANYADLQVTGLGTTPTSPQSGSTLTINWNDANSGNAAVNQSFSDQVQVVNTSTAQTLVNTAVFYNEGAAGAISTGGFAPRSYSFQLPNGTPGTGTLQITVTTDVDHAIKEYDASGNPAYGNNSATTTITSTPASYPDLATSNVTAPATVVPGQQITVGWSLANIGSASANGPWTEQILLATDAAGGNPTLLGALPYAGPLAGGQSVPRTATVQIPTALAGNYWLVVSENPLGEVYETNTANNTSVASQPTNIAGALMFVLANHSVSNGAGANATTATVSRNSSTSNALVVTLSNGNSASVSIPPTVTIPAGQTSVTFSVGTINGGIVVGTQTVALTASAAGVVSGSDTLTVTDVNLPTLTLALASHSIDENAANPATTGTITRNTSTTSALVVSLVSNAMNKLTVPASVTIPAGQASVTFPVTVVNDGQIDGSATATITAASAGFGTGSDSAVVSDDNVPALGLTLAQHTVSEKAQNPVTTGIVSIGSPASNPITIALTSSNTTAATVPATVVIGAGQRVASFPITAVDDGLDTGDKATMITAKVETNAGVILDQGSANDNLLLKEADGPALTVSIAVSAVNKGTTTTATLTRNTTTTAALVVNLASSDPTKASVPATVTIPVGQTSVSFTVSAIDDHTPDGLQTVQITASANGFDSGIAPLSITDVDLPDLVVTSVTAPTSGYNNTTLIVSWTVKNIGLYPANGSWLDQVFFDPVGGPQSTTPAGSAPFNGPVNPGQSVTQTDTLQFPAAVGQYIVRVVTDTGHTVEELSFSNNTGTAAQPLNNQASYTATVSTTVTTVSSGTPVPLTGVATMTSNSAPAANKPVAVEIMVAGTTRTLTATTDSSGHYSITFQPLQNEAGQYSVAAADPGVSNPAVQASFQIVGMTASPAFATLQVVPLTPLTGHFTLTDLSSTPLTGLVATAQGGPAGVTVQLSVPPTLAGSGQTPLSYTITASASAVSGPVVLHVTSAEGAVLDIPVNVVVAPGTPQLAANPGFLKTGMVVGTQTLVSFTVVNNGGAPSGNLQVSLPGTSYLSLASPATIPSLAPGASSTVTVQLSPPSNLPLLQYTGTLAVSNGQTGITVPFTFTAISNAVGDVHVLVDDDYTFQTPGSPHVQGATVNLVNPYDNTQIVATGVTDAAGAVTLSNVHAGPYVLQVQASGHSTYNNSYTVVPGITNNDEVFIQRQFVSYTWVVQQTTIQDTYQIKLQTTFETNVPAPVVTITAPAAIPTLAPGQSGTFNVTITNHGLIAAQGVTLVLPTDQEYTFTALTTMIGVLPAQSSVVVPVTVTRAAPQPVSNSEGGTTLTTKVEVPNPIESHTASTLYVDYSNTGTVSIPAPLLVLTATQNGNAGAFLSLDPALAGLGYNSNTTPAGFSQTVQFLASGATPGVLKPGESVTIPVYYAGWLSSQWAGSAVTFSLSEAGTSNTHTIDWSSLAAGLRLGSINAAAWNAIAPILTAQLGSTWGQYVQTLDNDVAYLESIGRPTNDLNQLLSFEVEKANAGYTAQTLTSVTADNLPAPGLGLSFRQSFQQPISARYTQGILGYGWTTNWDISAAIMTNGDVAIKESGISRYFSLQPNGTYAPEPGDQGSRLTASGGAYQIVEAAGTVYQFNVNGSLHYVQDTHGNTITAGYNSQSQLVSLTHSNGASLTLTYNSQGHIATLKDSNGQKETYGYDATGQFLTSYSDLYGTTNYTYVTGASPAQNNALAQIAFADNTHIYFGYDSNGRLIDQHRGGGQEDQTWTYLSPGGYVVTDANNHKSTIYFDRFGAAAVAIDPLGNVTHSYYDSSLNLTKVIGPGGATYSFTYDANGNVTSRTDPLGLTTYFTFDSHNNLSSYTDAKGNTTVYGYNSKNDLLSINYANGTEQSYSYNPLGEATQYLNARGQAVGFTYNAQGQVATEQFANGTSFSYTYSTQGNLTSAKDAQSNVTTFLYSNPNNPDLLTEVDYPDGTWLKFSYNTVGQRIQSVDQTAYTVNYGFDALGRLSQLTDGSDNLIVKYTYDNACYLIQKDMGNGTRAVYTYDADGNVLSITNYAAANGPVNSFDLYTYDARGNVLNDTNQDGKWVYNYDADSQLIGAVFAPNSTNPDGLTAQNLQYVYDAAGNRQSETVNGVTTIYVVNNVNEYTSSTTNGITTGFQYDADGNLIAQTTGSSTTTYSFNVLNQLTAVNGPGLTASYGYDPLGHRTSQTVNGVATHFQIDPARLGNVVATFGGAGALTAHYTYGFGLVSQVSSTGIAAYYDFNKIGSTVGITGTRGTYINKYAYMPFGQTITVAATLANLFTFVGQFGVRNGGGLLDMRARSYNPSTGQFMSPDAMGLSGGLNLYSYSANNPIRYIDPSGYFREPTYGLPDAFWSWLHKQQNGELIKELKDPVTKVVPQDVAEEYYAQWLAEGSPDPRGPFYKLGPTPEERLEETLDPEIPANELPAELQREIQEAINLEVLEQEIELQEEIELEEGEFLYNPEPELPGASVGAVTTSGGSCTLAVTGSWFYDCGPNKVTSLASSLVSVPWRDCSAQGVQVALAGIGGGGGGGGGGVGGFFIGGAGGGGGVPPAIVSTASCNPQRNNIARLVALASSDAIDPPINTGPAVTGTNQIANAHGPPGDPSPVTFIVTALGNLGLINGQSGNAGYTAAELAQMVATIATFDQVEADIAGILATASGGGGSLGITGDIALLQQVDARLQAVTAAEKTLFGGDANWLDTTQSATLQQWVTAFFADAQDSSDGGETITAAERAQLLATTLPSTVSTAEANVFLDRWNRTVQYWGQGIYTAAQVPAGQSTDFLDVGALQTAFNAAHSAELVSQANGYSDPLTEMQAALTTVQNDLAGLGVCATVKLQINQTATLTRSAFSGTLSITNSEGTGAMTNVVMNINITDAQGNPANGKFFISSPSYSGSFSVVNGHATLPDHTTGTIAFTFIPNDSAASSAPTLYRIGGTIGFTDPAGGAIGIAVFPATITVLPQAQLKLNYFLQRDVIGADPFSSQVVTPEPAILGLLVTNVGLGTANNLSITTAQPQIIENEKGLLVNFQIIGTQVGAQQVTPSLQVNFGNIAPGQTADADFLLLSSLQGIFTNFTASFTHSDALGGLDTSLIKSVRTHTLIHAGNFNFPGSTGAIDYLAEDNANPGNLPDTVYFSNGTTAPVHIATNVQSSAGTAVRTFKVTASVTSGWNYIQLPDPGAAYTLSQVVRSDGKVMRVRDEAWTTDRTINAAGRGTVDYELHILDLDSTGSYTVTYVPVQQTAPTSSVTALPAFSPNSFTVSWSGSGGLGALSFSIYVSDNSGAFMPWLTASTQTSAIYTGVSGHVYGFYSVATDSAGNQQAVPTAAQASTHIGIVAPPVLSPIGNKIVSVGQQLTFTATATDPNVPPDPLTFSLDAGAPTGASINPTTGVFTWTPALAATFTATVRVTDANFPALSALETITLTVKPLATVVSEVVNDGNAQRSMVNSITITFSTTVTLDAGAFSLVQQGGAAEGLIVSTSVVNGKTVAVLTFTGDDIVAGSLSDGRYTLTIDGTKVHDATTGANLDGGHNGTAGSNYVDATLLRLFGDTTGKGSVDYGDYYAFWASYGTHRGDAGYLWYLDYNNDGVIDDTDFAAFMNNFGRSL